MILFVLSLSFWYHMLVVWVARGIPWQYVGKIDLI